MKKARVLVFAAVVAAVAGCRTIPGRGETLPTDPAVAVGRLSNGLTYYIRANRKPENTAEMRLVVNAGSVLEDENQRGLAHFVEHMAFNGTKGFPEEQLIHYLESMGIEFGPELNASTSFDETVYRLQVPTRSWDNLDTGLRILSEWASAVTFDDRQIDKERGVIVEEWRTGRGAEARIRDKQIPALLAGSRYARATADRRARRDRARPGAEDPRLLPRLVSSRPDGGRRGRRLRRRQGRGPRPRAVRRPGRGRLESARGRASKCPMARGCDSRSSPTRRRRLRASRCTPSALPSR